MRISIFRKVESEKFETFLDFADAIAALNCPRLMALAEIPAIQTELFFFDPRAHAARSAAQGKEYPDLKNVSLKKSDSVYVLEQQIRKI